ncbi:penicillin-binding protein 2 [Paraglaciecola sp. MB-3u-78]|uniref:penicillin-binding protein 2 n=1 Tax=Paraglaciecola sp. MB-3u-78 TaxID=2058332 RepID=UPI000C31EDA5|nr:penicillin-binding protein 2 [Paraglaciecola sp. MB-3u-78]PKG99057.1 penicillin-binding protein 2 [Paraglaciecola sp. MB-3u-78]
MPSPRILIKDHSAEANLFARRTFIGLLVVFVMIAMVLTNLYYLQISRFEDYQTRADGNRIKVLPVAPNRGLIYDRNGILLAENRPVFSLQVIPEEIDDLELTINTLSILLDIDKEDVSDFYRDLKGTRRFKPVNLINRLKPKEVALFSAQQHKYPGISVEARLARYYPYGSALTHVIGYVAKINKKDLQKLSEAGFEANYAATYDIGKRGIEKYHEEKLHGKVGFQEVEVNNQGRIIRILDFSPPAPGQDIVLNIDMELQQEAEKAFAGMKGSVVAIDPRDGGVLALYSSPSYDPNLFVHGISSKNYKKLLTTDRPLFNRATQGQYPPASTVKPLLALTGLEAKVITPESRIYDVGKYKLKNVEREWRDHNPWGHGWVDVTKAIEVSCDIFFYDLAYKLGIDRISESMYEFGFGDYTGIDLHEEADGIMPSRGIVKALFNLPWYIGDTINIGIGQSYWTATPVQLTQSIVTLVNRGRRIIPQIIRGNMQKDKVVVQAIKERRPIAIKDEHNWDIVLDAMYGTVNRKGSARNAFKGTNYTSAGKTGTAQLVSIAADEKYDASKLSKKNHDNAMYVGYAPYDKPQIVLSVVLENAGHGGAQAAPIARKMMDNYFKDQTFPEHQVIEYLGQELEELKLTQTELKPVVAQP